MDDKVVFSVPWFDVLARAVDGSASPYYFLRTCDYVTVLAATEEGSFLLVRQYRPAVGVETLELPSGHVEDGELPEAAARRELAEETGYEAKKYELLGTLLPDTGRLGNKLWCFYAADATQMRPPVSREVGVHLVLCHPRDLIRQVMAGKINCALHMAVLFLAAGREWLSIGDGR
jgi:ADP-ribose pyrophosphatase